MKNLFEHVIACFWGCPSEPWRRYFRNFAWCGLFVLGFTQIALASDTKTDSTAQGFGPFRDFDYSYQSGRFSYAKVDYLGTQLLWNPADNSTTYFTKDIGNYVTRFNPYRTKNFISDSPGDIGDGITAAWVSNGPQKASSFSRHIEIWRGKQKIAGFFVFITKSDYFINLNPRGRFCCDSYEKEITLHWAYGDTDSVFIEKLFDGRFFIYAAVEGNLPLGKSIAVYGIKVDRFVTYPLSVDHQLFIIPDFLMVKELNAVGDKLQARYSVAVRFITAATNIKMNQLGYPEGTKKFFHLAQ